MKLQETAVKFLLPQFLKKVIYISHLQDFEIRNWNLGENQCYNRSNTIRQCVKQPNGIIKLAREEVVLTPDLYWSTHTLVCGHDLHCLREIKDLLRARGIYVLIEVVKEVQEIYWWLEGRSESWSFQHSTTALMKVEWQKSSFRVGHRYKIDVSHVVCSCAIVSIPLLLQTHVIPKMEGSAYK